MRTRILAMLLAGVSLASLCAAPVAAAAGLLVVGMPIEIGRAECTLGFFGFNAAGDRLAVTAGHCSAAPDQVVYSDAGVPIGDVVLRRGDVEDSDGYLIGARGYTLIRLVPKFDLEPYFTDIGTAEVGDRVRKYGRRTGKTAGHVTAVRAVKGNPDLGLISSDMVQLPGDSGCPWVTGTTLVGIGSSGNMETSGGEAGSQGQPVWSVIEMIRRDSDVWGEDFKVWVQT